MKKEPLVSVIIPCYNCEQFIGDAIRSCLSQTYQNIEVIVLEDRGGDNTYQTAKKIEDPRLRVLQNEKNLGQHLNKNRGLELSKGALIKYCDGDDALEPTCIAHLVGLYYECEGAVGMVACRLKRINAAGEDVGVSRVIGVEGLVDGRSVLEVFLAHMRSGSPFGNPTAVLFDRKALESAGGFPKDHSWSGDLETFLRVLIYFDGAFTELPLVSYRDHPGGVGGTRKIELALEDNLRLVERMRNLIEKELPTLAHRCERPLTLWVFWVNRSFIFSHFTRKLRCKENRFLEIKNFYKACGYNRGLLKYIFSELLGYVCESLLVKFRKLAGLPGLPRLFNSREREYIRILK